MEAIIKFGLNFIKKYGRYPTLIEYNAAGITRAEIRNHFDNLGKVKDHLSKQSAGIFDLERSEYNGQVGKQKRIVLTTAITECKVDTAALAQLNNYCKREDAQLVILVSKLNSNGEWLLDPVLKDYCIITKDTALNNNAYILGVINTAHKVDPITGLPRIGQRNGTFISASPKQRLKYVATGPSKLPHALMSTGAITKSLYEKKSLIQSKNNYIAQNDHVMGAIIVEIEDKEVFHFRQIQFDKDGSFADLGYLYQGGKKKQYAPEAFVLGDWHAGKTCPVTQAAWYDVSSRTKTKRWIIHDFFDGNSINHHDTGKQILLAQKALAGQLDLKTELDILTSDLLSMSQDREVVIVKSNHDEFLERYLQAGYYIEHPYNHRLALDLAAAYMDGSNPVQFYVDSQKLKFKNKVTWLKRDESYEIASIQLGAHGDKGANGSRGSNNAMENAYGNVVYGHSHTPEINRGAWCVGTSTETKPDYGTGPSSWMNSSCLIYKNGNRQMINSIDGKYTTKRI